MILDSTSEDLIRLREDFQKMKTRIATGVAMVVVVAGIIGWAAELFWQSI